MYLLAAEIREDSVIEEYKGTKGKFLKTFGISNKRNKNEWRAKWAGILENIHTAIGMPGIAYEKCVEGKCGLDHVEADSFEEVIEKQKPYEVAEIIDYTVNDEKKQIDFIYKVHDDDFYEKVKNGKIKYVSPMIWPKTGGIDIVGVGRDNIPQIDAHQWNFVHEAFLEENPAFGNDANISALCEGDNCQVKLLTAKEVKSAQLFGDDKEVKSAQLFGDNKKANQLFAETSIANSENLSHLQEVPLLYRHKGKLHYMSASKCVQDIIKKKKSDGIEIDEQALAIAYSECGESGKENSSFKACTCSKNDNMSQEMQTLQANYTSMENEKKELESKLKGMEDEDKKEKSFEASKAKYASVFKGMEEKDREDLISKFKSAMSDDEHDKSEMKAMEENHEEMKKGKKGQTEDPEKKELEATLKAMQASQIPGMIGGLIAVKKSTGATREELTNYNKALEAKSFLELQKDFTENQPTIIRLQAKTQSRDSYEFDDTTDIGALTGKTLNETFGDSDE